MKFYLYPEVGLNDVMTSVTFLTSFSGTCSVKTIDKKIYMYVFYFFWIENKQFSVSTLKLMRLVKILSGKDDTVVGSLLMFTSICMMMTITPLLRAIKEP